MNKLPLFVKIQILMINLYIKWFNFLLIFFKNILFFKKNKNPQNILIYKIGNIGDIVCAAPSFIAIRRNFPKAKITLLTSPGKCGALGAKELLQSVWYLDEMKVYYGDEIDSWNKRKKFIRDLRGNKYDLFIQLPDDLANFRTLFRNMVFAKLLGVKHAFGFKIRTIQLFKKTQVDYTTQKTEVESLLDLLKENGLKIDKVEYNFNVSEEQKNKIKNLLKEKFGELSNKDIVVAVGVGGKREANQWPVENFSKIGKYLQDEYGAKIIIIGGKDDVLKANIISQFLNDKNLLITAGQLELLETMELFKNVDFLISNDTGVVHMAAAVGLPVIGLFCIRNVFGRWFPYGEQHRIIYSKFLDCDYRKENCIAKSVKMITIDQVINTCNKIIKNKKYE